MVDGPRTYEPNPALAWLYERFFANIEVDGTWAARVREADARGTVVYVLRNLSFVDFLALDHLTKRLHLPQVRFANDLGLWLLEPMGRGWLQALRPRTTADDVRTLRQAIDGGHSAALFLKRPPTLLEPPPVARTRRGVSRLLPSRGKTEGDAFLKGVIDAQRARSAPILLVPQVFVWTRSPDHAEQDVVDALFGPREWPGNLRTAAQFLMNFRHVTLRAGEPLDVKAFLEQAEAEGAPRDDDALVRRLTYALLRRLERERRGVLGPTRKPADRLREQVIRSPRLARVLRDMAGGGKNEQRVLGYRALAMLREMEAEVDVSAVRALDTAFDATVARMYSAFEIDEEGLARVREAAKDGTLVLLPSHKSHVDYIVLTRLFFRSNLPVPLVAAGDNLAFFPLGPILRRAGAFFIRRSFKGDRLYGAVVDAYMRRLLKDGYPLEFFLEGGRSRTGKLLPPKLGLLSIVVDAALGSEGDGGRKVWFVPISIGYERVVEERAYVRELTGAEKQKEDVRGLLGAAESALGRYGRLNVQFGELLTLDEVLAEMDAPPSSRAKLSPAKRRALIQRLAYRVMNEINRVTAVTPGALVAAALLTHGQRGIAHADLVAAARRLASMLRSEGARFTPSLFEPSGELRVQAVREALELFARAGHVEAHRPGRPVGEDATKGKPGADAVYVVPDDARLSLAIAKNLLVHFFVSRATIATPLAARHAERGLGKDDLRERVRALSRLLKFELQFRADAPFEAIFDETLAAMAKDGEVVLDAETVHLGRDEGRTRALVQARMIAPFVEGYRVAARALTALLKGPLASKDLAKRALAIGERMFLAGEIAHREAVSQPVLENALLAFVDQGYLARADGKLVLPESYTSAEAVATIEARIAGDQLAV